MNFPFFQLVMQLADIRPIRMKLQQSSGLLMQSLPLLALHRAFDFREELICLHLGRHDGGNQVANFDASLLFRDRFQQRLDGRVVVLCQRGPRFV